MERRSNDQSPVSTLHRNPSCLGTLAGWGGIDPRAIPPELSAQLDWVMRAMRLVPATNSPRCRPSASGFLARNTRTSATSFPTGHARRKATSAWAADQLLPILPRWTAR